MQVRILGAHKLEDRQARHTCFLIDGMLAVDAGSLASSLSVAEQGRIRAVLLTHCHFDHIRDLPTLGLATLDSGSTIEVWALPHTLDAVHENILNTRIYPDLTGPVGPSPAKFIFHPIKGNLEGDSIIDVLGYEVRPVSMQHTVPSVGFMVRSKDGGCIGYTGDTSGGLSAFFQGASPVSLLFVDLSFPDRLIGLARLTGHLTPDLLRKEILEGLEHNFDLPRIVPVHLSQYHEEEIAREVARLSQELGRDLVIGREDMEIEVGVESRTGCPVSRGSPSGNHGFSVPLL